MTKLAIIISSALDIEGPSFCYTPEHPRSFFTTEERFRQTIGTIYSLKNAFPDATIFLVDSGDTINESLEKNIEFLDICLSDTQLYYVSIKELDVELFKTIKNHTNKSFCESASILCFMEKYKKQLMDFDFIIKASGRYLYDFRNNTNLEKNKIFFKPFKLFAWSDEKWADYFRIVDNREEDGDYLGYACSAIYGFDTKFLEEMMDVLLATKHLTYHSSKNLDLECCLYYLTRSRKHDIINMDWSLTGFCGVRGDLVHW